MFKSNLFTLSFLPSATLIIILLIMFSTSGQLATVENNAALIGKSVNAFDKFFFLRNLFFVGYVVYFLIQVKSIYTQKVSNRQHKVLTLVGKTLLGIILIIFSYFFAALIYDLISIVLTLITNPNYILKR